MDSARMVVFYETDEEGRPVQAFLDGLDNKRRAKLLAMIRLLEEQGPTVSFPLLEPGPRQNSGLRAHYGEDACAGRPDRGGADAKIPGGGSAMKRAMTNWDRYYRAQMRDPEVRRLVEDELRALRVGVQLARLRQRRGLSQTTLAARAGMSAPNISRIESSPSQNLTLGTLVRLARAMDYEPEITFKPRRGAAAAKR